MHMHTCIPEAGDFASFFLVNFKAWSINNTEDVGQVGLQECCGIGTARLIDHSARADLTSA